MAYPARPRFRTIEQVRRDKIVRYVEGNKRGLCPAQINLSAEGPVLTASEGSLIQ
jgi:hypothetical protein